MNHIGTPLRSVPFDGIAYDLSCFSAASFSDIIPHPPPIEIPSQLQPCVGITGIEIRKRKPGYVIEKLAIAPESDPTGIFIRRLHIFSYRFESLGFSDLYRIPLLDPLQQVFPYHPLNLPPVVWTNRITRPEVNVIGSC
jgi:hypothetical protein